MPNFIKIRLVGAEFVPRGLTEGRSDMTVLLVAFRKYFFAKAK